ncbi:2Fe-2S iron-sulfur cluster-binding protein [Serratia ureilytica]
MQEAWLIWTWCGAATASPADHERQRCWRKVKAGADADIDAAMGGNVCRCAAYVRIRAAIHQAAKALG